jgi:peptidoglycan/LPS O-acetylase OafA/YrhL
MLRPGQTRFILAFMVIMYHLSASIFLGGFAVSCFFFLSGYWIGLMFDNKYSKFEQPLKVFYISRLWRLMPVFYTFTLLCLLVNFSTLNLGASFMALSGLDKLHSLFANILLLGYSNSPVKILVPAWSLDIELQFYIIFPLLAYFFRKNRTVLLIITLLFFLATISFFILPNVPYSYFSYSVFYLFFVGVSVYHFNIKVSPITEKVSFVLLLIVFFSQYLIPSIRVFDKDATSFYRALLNFVMTTLAIPVLIRSIYNRTSDNDKFWGEMSFLVYLSHWVWLIPYNTLIVHATKLQRVPYVIGFLAVTFLSSYLVYKFIDRPSETYRHKWIKKQKFRSAI